jgi:ribonuclease BN (tRNA processing enzyme)
MSDRLTLTILGSGDPFGSGGRNQSGYLVEAGSLRLLLDCGVTTPVALKRQGLDPANLQAVILTHLHADHVAGLPLLYHEFQHLSGRDDPLTVAGPRGVKSRVERIYRVLYPPKAGKTRRFRVDYRELRPGIPFYPDGRRGPRVRPFRVSHQGNRPNFGYCVRWKGRTLAYSGDTQWFEDLPAEVRGADLFVCECTQPRRAADKHLSLEELRDNRQRLEVGSILLTHLGPKLASRRRIAGFKVGRDGMTLLV